LGCTGTHFVNPHGLHDEDHYTTANDMAKIARQAIQNETFRTITNSPSYDLPATNLQEGRKLSSTNQLINKDIPSNAYYYSPVQWAVRQGITAGTGDGTFSPDAPCTRAQVVTFLWRVNGSPV
jgi:hypothetical protein